MPRLTRLDAPGILHHVIIRGIERKAIFRDKTDKEMVGGGLVHSLDGWSEVNKIRIKGIDRIRAMSGYWVIRVL